MYMFCRGELKQVTIDIPVSIRDFLVRFLTFTRWAYLLVTDAMYIFVHEPEQRGPENISFMREG